MSMIAPMCHFQVQGKLILLSIVQIQATTGSGKALLIILCLLLHNLGNKINQGRRTFGKVLIMCFNVTVRLPLNEPTVENPEP
jgi:hypothetical protein